MSDTYSSTQYNISSYLWPNEILFFVCFRLGARIYNSTGEGQRGTYWNRTFVFIEIETFFIVLFLIKIFKLPFEIFHSNCTQHERIHVQIQSVIVEKKKTPNNKESICPRRCFYSKQVISAVSLEGGLIYKVASLCSIICY